MLFQQAAWQEKQGRLNTTLRQRHSMDDPDCIRRDTKAMKSTEAARSLRVAIGDYVLHA